MSALAAAVRCSLMMIPVIAALAWYGGSSGKSNGDGDQAEALEAEIAELRQQQADASSGGLRGRG